ncbi:hypothetical protein [Candidatus Phycosocius spiralis]|nr:hypothetical protein [Candidatus Phycosocius spiralis]
MTANLDAWATDRKGFQKSPSTKLAPKKRKTTLPSSGKSSKGQKVKPNLPVQTGFFIPPGANTLGTHAALYAAYASDVGALSINTIQSGPALTLATERVARHLNSDRLALGIVAYGAAWAATNDQFVTEVRKLDAQIGREALITKLRTEIAFARTLRGGEQAAQTAARALTADAKSIQNQSSGFKQAAYDWQKLRWAMASTMDAKVRNNALRKLTPPAPVTETALALSALPEATLGPQTTQARTIAISDSVRLASQAARDGVVLSEPIRAWSPIDRMVSLAALSALGGPIDRKEDTEALMRDPRLVSCVNSSRLNMQMCNAATKQPYERSYCLAEHPLGEIAICMAKTVR